MNRPEFKFFIDTFILGQPVVPGLPFDCQTELSSNLRLSSS